MPTMLDISGLGEYTPYEGLGRSDLLSKDGTFMLAITKAVPAVSKETKKEMINLALNVIDDPENVDNGKSIIHSLVIGGVDKNGKPMIRNLGDLLLSIGYSVDQIKAFSGKKQIDIEALCRDTLVKADKPVRIFATVAAEAYTADDGSVATSSKVQNLVAKAKYEEAVAVRAHRKAHRFGDGAAPAAHAASGGGLGEPGAAAAKPNGAAKPATGDLAGL